MRKSDTLRQIYETSAPQVTCSTADWKQYLTFASQFHKYSFDNALLVYSQRQNVTALATLAQWNSLGRSIGRGEQSIAVCEYENAQLTLRYLFDISQTYGKEVALPDWKLSENIKSQLAESHGISSAGELFKSLATDVISNDLEKYTAGISTELGDGYLPENGSVAQYAELLADSIIYYTSKRCNLSDDEIPMYSGLETISDINTLPLIARFGASVAEASRGILRNISQEIKSIIQRSADNEQINDRTDLHGERRTAVPEPANLERPNERPTVGALREDGSGIPENGISGALHSSEDGRQPDGDNAQSPDGSDRENRSSDTGAVEIEPNASEPDNGFSYGGHIGENPPPEQSETDGGGNSDEGDNSDTEITTTNIEPEPPTDGSFSMPEPKSPRRNDLASRNYRTLEKLFPDIISRKYSYMRMESGGFEPLSLEWLYNNRLSMMHFYEQNGDLMRDPDMELQIDTENGTVQAFTYELSGMGVYQQVERNGYTDTRLQRELNSFLAMWLKNISSQKYEIARATEMETGEEIEFDNHTEIQTFKDDYTATSDQISLFDSVPDTEREREEYLLTRGSGFEGGKQRIYDFALTNPTGSTFGSFLKKEYGIGGSSVGVYGISFVNYDSKGISYTLDGSDEKINISWAKAAGIIGRLVSEGRYLDAPKHEAVDDEIRITDESVDFHDEQSDMVMSAFKGETQVAYMDYSIYNDTPYISLIEVMPEYRRQGIATQMLQNLQQQYPDTEIMWGMLTEDGKALYDAITVTTENQEYTAYQERLDEINRELDLNEREWNDGVIFSEERADGWNDLHDEKDEIIKLLQDIRSTTTFIKLDDEVTEVQDIIDTSASIEPETVPPQPHNFKYSDDMNLYPSGVKSKYRANVEAVKLLRQIESDHRNATPEEQTVLAGYVGWGGLSNAFNENSDEWNREYIELKTILSDTEYRAAMESTLTAYYTEPELVRHIYSALEQFGFKGGSDRKLLDPAMGTGNFYSVLPEKLDGTKLYGVELDPITARIAKQLYPEADIQNRGYENTHFDDNSFDVAIGNIPFNNIKVIDPRYDDNNFLIHDYFIAKTLDLVKPGGLIAFITSKGTLDKQNSSVRRYIAERAELVGAIRLPITAFKALAGTEVTTDILFLQKRPTQIELTDENEPEWLNVETAYPGYLTYNKYFQLHPEMVLGEIKRDRSMYGREDGIACVAPDGYDLYGELAKAIGTLNAEFTAEPDMPPAELTDEEETEILPYENAPEGTRNYTFVVKDNSIFYCENNKLVPQNITGVKAERIKGLCAIRLALLDVIAVQSKPYEESELTAKQVILNSVYDRFTAKYGAIGSKGNILVFSDDDQFPLLRSIENEIKEKDGSIRYEKAQIFNKATIRPYSVPTHVDTAEEAMYLSLNTRLKIDLRYMSALTDKEPTDLINELGDMVYLNPEKYYGNIYECWETAEEYLSGNVKDKLLYAKSKAEDEPDLFSRNVAALEAVQPTPLTPADIDASIGAPWIPIEFYQEFMYETFNTPSYQKANGYHDNSRITLSYMEYSTQWRISNKVNGDYNVTTNQTYGTKRKNAYEIYEDCLNLQSTTVKDKVIGRDKDGNDKEVYVVNVAETRIARSKQAQIKEAFAAWLWKEPDRRDTLLQIYNDRFNTTVPRTYNGSHLIFPGMSDEMKLRPHQANFAARVIYSGTGLAAHEVGAGKTAALIAAGMYMKNLGAIKKPVYVVPNPLVGQWAMEFYRFFPNANLLVSTAEDFSAKNRNRYVSRIAMGDYDAVILAHSQFERIPMSKVWQEQKLEEQISEISLAIARLKADNGENWTIKQMVAFQKNLSDRLQRLSAEDKKDNMLTFEQLGVDFMFVDEAHMFKNCFVYTKLSRVAGVNTSSSQRAFDMLNKCQFLQGNNNGRGVVFATGTPISNSMSEMYVMMRYLEPQELKRQGLSNFDSWAATYGQITSSLEITPEGGGYRMRQRFAKFRNLPELMRTFQLVSDIQTAEMLKLARPEIRGGKAEVMSAPATPYQKIIMESFIERAEAILAKAVDATEDNMLKLTGEARLMAIDPRLLDPDAPNDPETKLNRCIDNVYKVWHETAADHLTQLVFCDCGTPKAGEFNVYDEMKDVLMGKGVPDNEICFIHDAKTEAQRQAIFDKTRNGDIRILIGSTGKLGTGVNVQDKVIALHHLDVPWKPSDITQRDGRGLRQGNQNPEIQIYHYITEGSFDSYLWQIQEQKLRYITQVMCGKSMSRTCEDLDETVLTAAQFKAVATDNPKLLEKMELENRVTELRLLQRNYQNEQSSLERNINRAFPADIAHHEQRIAGITTDIETLKANENADFSITIADKIYTERAKAGEMLLLYSRQLNDNEQKIGEYRGLTLSLRKGIWDKIDVCLAGKQIYSCEIGATDVGTVSRIENLAERIPQMLAVENQSLTDVQSQLEAAKERYGQPFVYESELAEKSAALTVLDTDLELGVSTTDANVIEDDIVLDENKSNEESEEDSMDLEQ